MRPIVFITVIIIVVAAVAAVIVVFIVFIVFVIVVAVDIAVSVASSPPRRLVTGATPVRPAQPETSRGERPM